MKMSSAVNNSTFDVQNSRDYVDAVLSSQNVASAVASAASAATDFTPNSKSGRKRHLSCPDDSVVKKSKNEGSRQKADRKKKSKNRQSKESQSDYKSSDNDEDSDAGNDSANTSGSFFF